MQKRDIKEILEHIEAGRYTAEEEEAAKLWLFQLNQDKNLDLSEERLNQVTDKMWAGIEESQSAKPGRQRIIRIWPRIAAAASIIFILGLGSYLHFHKAVKQNLTQVAKNDILPGKNTAMLTLASGKVINLSAAKTGVIINASKMAYNDGSAVANAPLSPLGGSLPKGAREIEQLTASTPRGGQYQVTLPDGTKVWLNAASKLQFPNRFVGAERRVTLIGEAYFEVVHNAKQPFRVESKGQVVEDIGTHFNINSYTDEPAMATTLLEGSVRISALSAMGRTELLRAQRGQNNKNFELDADGRAVKGEPSTRSGREREDIILQPGQQAVLVNNIINVTGANIRSVMAWKNGKFVFDDESLASIMRKVSRWYDVEVIYQGIDPETKFGGSVSRFEKVSKVLEKLERTGSVHFEIEGRRIIVRK